MRIRIISALLVCVMLVGSVPALSNRAIAATNHSQAEAVEWIKARGNESWWQDVDGAYGCQCVDLAFAYYMYLVGYRVGGNGCDFWTNRLPDGWYRDYTPTPGCVVSWKSYGASGIGENGHVGLVYAVDGNTIYTVETNVNTSGHSGQQGYSNAKFCTRTKNSGMIFIHPDFAPQTPPEPPTPPTTDAYVSVFGTTVTVSWTDVKNETSYDIYLIQEPWGWDSIKYSQNVPADSTSYSFTNVAAGQYCAFIIARPNDNTAQGKWAGFSVTLPSDTPVLNVNSIYDFFHVGDTVTLSWNRTDNTTTYEYFIAEYPFGDAYNSYVKHGFTNDTSVSFNDLNNGEFIAFIYAVNELGGGPQSNWVHFTVSEDDNIPVSSMTFNGHIYELYDYEISWYGAKMLCERMGGHLVSITTAEEQIFVEQMIDSGNKNAYWIGAASYNPSCGLDTWRWITDEAFVYSNWLDGEPNATFADGTREYFAEIRKAYNKQWNDVVNRNTSDKGFIIEIEPNDEYITYSEYYNGSDYYIIDKNSTWTQAEEYCKSMGGHLVSINSTEELSFIQSILEHGSRKWYYLGARKDSEEWKWIDGTNGNFYNWDERSSVWSGSYLMMYKSLKTSLPFNNTYYPSSHIKSIGFVCEVPHEHSYSFTSTTPPTCVASGSRTYTCSVCGDSYTETIPATGVHTFVNGVCTVCGAIGKVGDINGDGKLNSRDVIALMKQMLDPSTKVTAVNDLYCDGKLNARDVIALMKLVLTQFR